MQRLLRQPVLYLLLLLGGSFLLAWWRGALEPLPVPDTSSYAPLMEAASLYEALSGLRTYGYPLVLRLFGLSAAGWSAVPEFNFAVLALAIVLFWYAVALYARSGWMALAAAAPLCFGCAFDYLARVGPDLLALALALAALALLLWLATRPRSPWLWAALGVVTFLAYFVKPVNVFLVVLIPLTGAALALLRDGRGAVRAGRLSLALAALTLVPLLTYGAVRSAVVGHFGVGNLGGYNILGVASCFLDDALVEDLPTADQQWLAARILKWRKRRGWQPMRPDSPIEPYRQQHTPNIFRIAEPELNRALKRQRGPGWPDPSRRPMDIPGVMGETALEIDRRFGELGRSIVRRRPHLYLKWVREGIRDGLKTPLDCWWTPLLGLLVGIGVAPLAYRGIRDPRRLRRAASGSLPVLGLWLVGSLFFLGQLALVVLVHWLKTRYAAMATFLFPGLLGATLFEMARLSLPGRPPSER